MKYSCLISTPAPTITQVPSGLSTSIPKTTSIFLAKTLTIVTELKKLPVLVQKLQAKHSSPLHSEHLILVEIDSLSPS